MAINMSLLSQQLSLKTMEIEEKWLPDPSYPPQEQRTTVVELPPAQCLFPPKSALEDLLKTSIHILGHWSIQPEFVDSEKI